MENDSTHGVKINYPFAAIPNCVFRSGIGAINIAVLGSLLSRGRTFCTAEKAASEIGISRSSFFGGIKFWQEHGQKYGVQILSESREGMPTVYEVEIISMSEGCPTNGRGGVQYVYSMSEGCPTNGRGGVQYVYGGVQPAYTGVSNRRTHKKNPIKKNPQEEFATASPSQDSMGANVNKIFAVFYDTINKQINFKQKTWRKAAEQLLAEYPLEDLLTITKFACEVQGQPYAPTITNPYQLREKMAALQIFFKKSKQPKQGAIQSL